MNLLHKAVRKARSFIRDEAGPTAVEYAVLVAMIVLVCAGAIKALGPTAGSQLQAVDSGVGTPTSGFTK